MHSFKRTISLLTLSCVLMNPVMAVTATGDKAPVSNSVYAQIKSIYLPAIGAIVKEDTQKPTQNTANSSGGWLWGKKNEDPKPELIIKPLTFAEKKNLAFDLLARNDETRPTGFLSQHTWEDLELFKQANLLRTINRTRTSFGEAVLGKMLVTGGDVEVALARQTAIKELVANEAELARLDNALEIAGKAEDVYLANFQNEDPAYEEYFQNLYFGWTTKLGLSNDNALELEAKTRWGNLANAIKIAGASPIVVAPAAGWIAAMKMGAMRYIPYGSYIAAGYYTAADNMDDQGRIKTFGDRGFKGPALPEPSLTRAKNDATFTFLKNLFMPKWLHGIKKGYNLVMDHGPKHDVEGRRYATYLFAAMGLTVAGIWAALAKGGYDGFKYQFEALKYLQDKLIPLGSAVRSMERLRYMLGNSAVLRSAMPEQADKLHRLFAGNGNAKLAELMHLLSSETFTGSASVLSLHGRVLAAHKLMQELKYELRDGLEALGTVDALVSVAKLYKEYAGQENKYCFVNLSQEGQPHLKAVNFWNPLVTMKKPVPNTVELGAAGKNRNMILTGQNTAGKSTTLRSLLQGVLLAHVFGIAPAQSMDVTSFKLIRTHINIHDDVEHGVSHYQAEVNNVGEMTKAIKSLRPGERCFVVIDELYHTTGPQTAVPLARDFFLGVAKFSNVMVISSTHYPELIKLEQETNGIYKNYKMEIHKVDGKLVRPHKIEEGWTTANVAADILAEQGITFFN